MKKSKLRIPIYDRTINVIVTKDIKKAIKKYCPEYVEEGDDNLDGTLAYDTKGRLTLMIPPTASINVICHESFHITRDTLEEAGMRLTDSSEEAFAYLVGWLAEEIEKIVNKY